MCSASVSKSFINVQVDSNMNTIESIESELITFVPEWMDYVI
ncbi:hypothetical protein QFZ28_005981 [Neobacillus niacini]|nr:hypothetical protein [Neobacillus niacini]MDQ1005403.1 hypothetical protein [Neobacillus niacini]